MTRSPDPTFQDLDAFVSFEDAGQYLDLSPHRVAQLVQQGFIPRVAPGKVSLGAAARGYIASLQHAIDRKAVGDTRLKDLRAAEIELRLEARRQVLVPREEAELVLDLVVTMVREELRQFPARIARYPTERSALVALVGGSEQRIAKARVECGTFLALGGKLPFSRADGE